MATDSAPQFVESLKHHKSDLDTFLEAFWRKYPDDYLNLWREGIAGRNMVEDFLLAYPEKFEYVRFIWASHPAPKVYMGDSAIERKREVKTLRRRDERWAKLNTAAKHVGI